MSGFPEWLPPLVLLEEYKGNWSAYLDALYSAFTHDFVQSHPRFRGRGCVPFQRPMSQGKEATFWHIISEGEEERDRQPDLRRCEHIGWVRAIIEHADTVEVKTWEKKHSKRGVAETRVYLWLEDQGYVVVLIDQQRVFRLLTAFPTTYDHTRRRLRKDYNESKRHHCPEKPEPPRRTAQ